MPKLRAICFDMDGIIVNSEPYHFKSTQLALKKEGIKYSQEQAKFFVGKTVKETITTICKENKIENNKEKHKPPVFTSCCLPFQIKVVLK